MDGIDGSHTVTLNEPITLNIAQLKLQIHNAPNGNIFMPTSGISANWKKTYFAKLQWELSLLQSIGRQSSSANIE